MAISDLSAYHRITADLLDISTALQGFAAPQAQAFGAPRQDLFQPMIGMPQQQLAAPTGQFDVQAAINSIIQVFQQLLGRMNGQNAAVGVGAFPTAAAPVAPPALPQGGAPAPMVPGTLPAAGAPLPMVPGIATPVPGFGGPVNAIQDQGKLLSDTGNVLIGVGQILVSMGGGQGLLSSPSSADASGVKQTSASAVATSGGYEIKALGPAEFSITGPDGKSTRIHGDPHVSESDGKNWDFKQDSTFILGDGTKINVKTVDAGNGTTVTDALEIISGNGQRAVMDGMKGGIGKVRTVDNAPEQFRTNQTFIMGKEADDWALADKSGQGRHREIMGNDKAGADTFQLGNQLEMPVAPHANVTGQFVPNQQNALQAPGGNTALPMAPQANAMGGGIQAVLAQVNDMLARLGVKQPQQLGTAVPVAAPAPVQALANPLQAAQVPPQGAVMSQLLGAMAQMLTVLMQSYNLGRGLNQNRPPLAV